MLTRLRIAKHRFTLEAVEALGLPRYKGSMLLDEAFDKAG